LGLRRERADVESLLGVTTSRETQFASLRLRRFHQRFDGIENDLELSVIPFFQFFYLPGEFLI
jgi:hypothetical protein